MKLISGMHRSGSSLVARLFAAAGADMGDPHTFYRPDQWNPEGYFEQPDIHAINFPLINGPFGRLSYLHLPSEATILSRAENLADAISDAAKKYDHKVVKENRFSLTFRAWQLYGGNFERVLICLRDPIQVAMSLKKRNWIPLSHGFYLWREHNNRLITSLLNIPYQFVYYADLLNPETAQASMKSMFDFMEVDVPSHKLEQLAKEHIKINMNNNPVVDYPYPPHIQELWIRLMGEYRAQKAQAAAYAG